MRFKGKLKLTKFRKKIAILAVLIFGLLLIGSWATYRIITHKTLADIITTPTVDNSLIERPVAAKAFTGGYYDLNFDPLVRWQQTFISPMAPGIKGGLGSCVEDYFNKTNTSQDRISCNITILSTNDTAGASKIYYILDISYKFYAVLQEGIYPRTYNTDNVKIDGLEKKDGYASVESRYQLSVPCDREKIKNCYVSKIIDSPENYSKGNFSTSYSITVSREEKLLEDRNLNKYISSEYEIDPTLSYWNFNNGGKFDFAADGYWDTRLEPKSKITNGKFCDQGCEVDSQETMKIVAKKKGLVDGIKGSIITFQDHKEKVTGKGTMDADGSKHWLPTDEGIKVIKDDNRSWKQDLSYNGNPVKYSGGSTSHAEIYPIQNKSTITTTNNYKNFSAAITTPPLPFMFWELRAPTTTYYEAAIKIDNQVSRDGTLTEMAGIGSYGTYTKGLFNRSYFKGIFDVQNPSMKITEGNLYPIGTVKSPFSMPIVEQHAQSYLSRESLKVPGYFTAVSQNAEETIMTTRPLKSIPKRIAVMRSYLTEDPAFSAQSLVPINNFITDLKAKGAEVTEHNTTSKAAMLSAFNSVSSGSWVINLGHGLPTALAAGKDNVKYSEIDQILQNKAIKIDVFAADSCFSGHSTLAETVIGSISFGFGTDNLTSGTLFGVGNQAWNYSSTDLANALRKLIGSPCSY